MLVMSAVSLDGIRENLTSSLSEGQTIHVTNLHSDSLVFVKSNWSKVLIAADECGYFAINNEDEIIFVPKIEKVLTKFVKDITIDTLLSIVLPNTFLSVRIDGRNTDLELLRNGLEEAEEKACDMGFEIKDCGEYIQFDKIL